MADADLIKPIGALAAQIQTGPRSVPGLTRPHIKIIPVPVRPRYRDFQFGEIDGTNVKGLCSVEKSITATDNPS